MKHLSKSDGLVTSRRTALVVALAGCVSVVFPTLRITPVAAQGNAIEASESPEEMALREAWKGLDEQQADEHIRRHLHGLVRATHKYYDKHGSLPPAVVPNPALAPEKRLSGFVLLLPHLENASWLKGGEEGEKVFDDELVQMAKQLYETIDLKKAWDDPVNRKAARTIVPPFLAPGAGPFRDSNGYAVSHFAFVRGSQGNDDGAFTDKQGLGFVEEDGDFVISDGSVNTLAMGQVNRNLGPWIAAGPSTSRHVYHASAGTNKPTFGGSKANALYFATCDSAVYFVDIRETPKEQLYYLAARADGHVLDRSKIPLYRTAAEWKAARNPPK